jgi:hypothetical protein
VDKLSIQNEMRCFDLKDRQFYNNLTDEERKKFSNFLMIRWGSSVQGSGSSRDLAIQQYYLQSCNENFNKYFFAINRHPKLQWLCATVVSPNDGVKRHQWIAPKKKDAAASGFRKQLAELFPHMKDDEIELMSRINTKKDIDAYIKQLG